VSALPLAVTIAAALLTGVLLGALLTYLRIARRTEGLRISLAAAQARLETREALGRDQALAQGALKERETALAQLVEPLRAALERTEEQVRSLERERREAYGSLRTQLEALAGGQVQLQRETRNLVNALRRPEVRGRWGELTLRRLVELAGLTEHCDFTEQVHLAAEDGALRPDLVVHMP
jgi:DNA recombination protein RmuC